MTIVHFATTLKNSCLTPIRDAIDAGGAAGSLKIYTGTIPADCQTAVGTQVLLGTLTFSYPSGTVASGTFTGSAITQDSSADASGTATWARVLSSTSAVVMDIDVTTTGGGGTLQMNTTNIVIGGPILVSAFVITVA